MADEPKKRTGGKRSGAKPKPPLESKQEHVRYHHIHEGDAVDDPQLVEWVRQASALSGEKLF